MFTAALACLLALFLLFSTSLTAFPILTISPSTRMRYDKAGVRPNPLELSFKFSDTTCSRPWAKMSKIILECWYKLLRLYLRSKLNYHGRQCLNKRSDASSKLVLTNPLSTYKPNEHKMYFRPKQMTLSHVSLWERRVIVLQNMFLILNSPSELFLPRFKIVNIELFCLFKKRRKLL